MSTYILMKILESTPSRYDRGIRLLTLGKLDAAYDRLTTNFRVGQKLLDVGCGTGALSLRAALKGAQVTAIDINPQMLEIARQRAEKAQLLENIRFLEMGVTELDSFDSDSYDVVMSGLCFSELSQEEIIFALREIHRILKTGGLLLIADEVVPRHFLKRVLNASFRFFLKVITYLVTQTTTRAVKNLPQKVKEAGLQIESVQLNRMENFMELIARKPGVEENGMG